MLKVIYFLCFINGYLFFYAEAYCTFFSTSPQANYENKSNQTLYRLSKLQGKIVTTWDMDHLIPLYDYTMCFCCEAFPTKVESDYKLKNAMIVQTTRTDTNTDKKKNYALGRLNETHLAISGPNWIFLSFTGTEYQGHCNHTQRKAFLMITCDASTEIGDFRFLSEDRDTATCHYLFQIRSKYVCEEVHGIGAAGIFCIIFFTILLSYFLFGFLYQRFVVGAKGMEQMPNFTFWHDFGNLQADGCDFICRSGSRYEPRAYKGIGDDRLRGDEEPVDDHLLPM